MLGHPNLSRLGSIVLIGLGVACAHTVAAGDTATPQGREFTDGVAIADVTGDGKPDVVAVALGGSRHAVTGVEVLRGRGDGRLAAGTIARIPDDKSAFAVGDLNGDGRPDVVVGGPGVSLAVALAGPDGALAKPVNYSVGGPPLDVAIGDLDGDGHQDLLVVTDLSSDVTVLPGNGDGTFRPLATQPAGVGQADIAAGDVNGDGQLDVVTTTVRPEGLGVLLGGGGGKLRPPIDIPVGDIAADPLLVDLNGDGHLDVALANFGAKTVSVLLGKGDGTFGKPAAYQALASPSTLAAGDVNGDGKPDLAVTSFFGDHGVAVLLGHGNGSFAAPRLIGPTLIGNSVQLGDLNGDGHLDLVAGAFDSVYVRLGAGDGSFRPAVATPIAPLICFVPALKGKTLKSARTALVRERCAVGRITRRVTKAPAGRVVAERPAANTELPNHGRVNLVISAEKR